MGGQETGSLTMVPPSPHMQKLYGDTLRKDAGVTKTLRNVAARNAHVLGGVTRGVKEVQGTFEKVLEETADAVEEFLNRCESVRGEIWLPRSSFGGPFHQPVLASRAT